MRKLGEKLEFPAIPVIGMVHLRPLPGSPRWEGDIGAVETAALQDADALAEAGVPWLMVENFHDVPFHRDRAPAETVAAMGRIVSALRRAFPDTALGVNMLRNDAYGALAVAAAATADMIRVNVLSGAVVTDQGLIQGDAARVMRDRRRLCPDTAVLADLRVKHGAPLAPRTLAEEAGDLRLRALADGIIISGSGTGREADPGQAARLREILPDCPILVGSGMNTGNIRDFAPHVDGYIVGSSLQEPGPSGWPAIDKRKAKRFVDAVGGHHPRETAIGETE